MARHDREESLEEQLAWLDAIKDTEEAPVAVSAGAESAASPYPKDPWLSVPSQQETATPPLFRAAVDSVYGAAAAEELPATESEAVEWLEEEATLTPPASLGKDDDDAESFLAPLKPLPRPDEAETYTLLPRLTEQAEKAPAEAVESKEPDGATEPKLPWPKTEPDLSWPPKVEPDLSWPKPQAAEPAAGQSTGQPAGQSTGQSTGQSAGQTAWPERKEPAQEETRWPSPAEFERKPASFEREETYRREEQPEPSEREETYGRDDTYRDDTYGDTYRAEETPEREDAFRRDQAFPREEARPREEAFPREEPFPRGGAFARDEPFGRDEPARREERVEPPAPRRRPAPVPVFTAPPRPPVTGRPTAESLDPESLLRGRRNAPAKGWRRIIYKASGGWIKPGEAPEVRRRRELLARARTPVATGHHRVAVLSLKGGVGKTTTTVGLGATLAQVRGDRVIAVDANPDRGTLSDKLELETSATVRDLLNERDQVKRYVDIRAFTSQAPSRLEVLASDRDPSVSEAFSADDYQAAAQVLENFYSICITDCGTGLLHSAMSGVLGMADQIVLVSSPSVDGARAASATLDWLEAHHYGDLVKDATVVLCSVRPRSKSAVDIKKLEAHFAARCRAVIRVPYDPHLEEGAEIDLDRLQEATREAYIQLAACVGDGFAGPYEGAG
ncbi:AAA family ATPase [Nonomuraea sp. NBC_01738]|uniref:nucleotide-binding protein n=1 Tax=Nonomuraea sp. NBC_01738 TaxID=2976003 RepID=UPI002E15144B|nr:AAA family ATPase [Nonomuraea sp. NBC_01738]